MPIEIDLIQRIVGQQLGLARVKPEAELVADLGAESLDMANLISALEERFAVTLEDDEIADLQTVADVHRLIAGKSS